MKIVYKEEIPFFVIENHDQMMPFFMSIVSDSNHWMFVSSNGGLTAGRKNADFALFPYYTDDKISELADTTASKSIFRIKYDNRTILWEPFSDRFNDAYSIKRNLYKSIYGNSIIFEEVFEELQLTFSYQWNSSNLYGFVRTASLQNNSAEDYEITVVDGIQNILPFGVGNELQNSTSNLVDAYKRSELHTESGLGMYTLSAIIVDKAEPSEALKCNVVWSFGIDKPTYLISSKQLKSFRKGAELQQETDNKGEKGAYFVSKNIQLFANETKNWYIVANVNQNQSQVLELCHKITHETNLKEHIFSDCKLGTENLIKIANSADGIHHTVDIRKDARHFSNVLFNTMRGGIFDHNYSIDKHDFQQYIAKANKTVFQEHQSWIQDLSETFSYIDLLQKVSADDFNSDLRRLSVEYLPLKFSRRHGDPSRPWNKFSINTQNEVDGSKILDYQGNWRDIFQNWETLAHSYPNFLEGMLFKFLNATTFDGYNPYRVTKDGFDWETIEAHNPWSYIGYWGDHQIIYLLKFLECYEMYFPSKLAKLYADEELFVYAAVPYIIKPYQDILTDSKNTIEYSHDWEKIILERKDELGADGALLRDNQNQIYKVTLIEKLLATVLSKISNFIPEAGIWMNTQRPEWNDANNALVGNGVSMVTLYYLRRFLKFFERFVQNASLDHIRISAELVEFYHAIRENLIQYKPLLSDSISDLDRKKIMDVFGTAASEYRTQIYHNGFWGKKRTHSIEGLQNFIEVALEFVEHSIRANERNDKMYHAYNIITIEKDSAKITHLTEMLEGQVAVLSSGFLSVNQSIDVLESLRKSALYREDQNSYMLYPNKELPTFLQKNTIQTQSVEQSKLLLMLAKNNNQALVNKDVNGNYHFNGNFQNANDVQETLHELAKIPEYKNAVQEETTLILNIFEETFNHKAFTGRSGTFFAYEGLGSIYWHMVSKLHLAVLEILQKAKNSNATQETTKLKELFYEIGDGIGVHKTPNQYGAFPTDPYSHTPSHRGAQQPGMTGQVKEDILVRMAELGVRISEGMLYFDPFLVQKDDFISEEKIVTFYDRNGTKKELELPTHSLAFSYCQIPIIYVIGTENSIEIHDENGTNRISGTALHDNDIMEKIRSRTSESISHITVHLTTQSISN